MPFAYGRKQLVDTDKPRNFHGHNIILRKTIRLVDVCNLDQIYRLVLIGISGGGDAVLSYGDNESAVDL